MKSKLKIHSQYFENYAAHDWDGKGKCPQSWKPKGGHIFEIEVDSDTVMYSTKLESHLKQIVSAQSSNYEKFEYLEHEMEFVQPTILHSEVLYSLLRTE